MSHATADRYAWAEPGVEDLGGGVHRIPLPLPMEGLKAVNVYAIADPGGVDLIDAGIALVPARERLAAGLHQIGYELGDIRNFLVTHIHIDHYSLAVELRRTFHSVISLGEQERDNLIALVKRLVVEKKIGPFHELKPGSPRTIEAWPLATRRVNGKATIATAELLALAEAKLAAAPVIRGGRRSPSEQRAA